MSFHDVSDTLTRLIEYRYDVFDNLIARLDNTDGVGAIEETRFYIHDPAPGKGGLDDLVLEYDGAGNVVHRYLHGAGIDQLFADEDALNEILWSLSDRQGTIRDWAEYDELADTTTVANHVVFDGFGKITSQTDPNHEVTIGYTGRFIDSATGLQWNRARWYDPSTGRWMGEDPIGLYEIEFEGNWTPIQKQQARDSLRRIRSRIDQLINDIENERTRLRGRWCEHKALDSQLIDLRVVLENIKDGIDSRRNNLELWSYDFGGDSAGNIAEMWNGGWFVLAYYAPELRLNTSGP